MTDVYVAAGSNIDPERNLRRACQELRRSFGAVRFSRAYRNVAVGFDGDDFVNLAVAFETRLTVDALIAELQRIEALCGRERHAPKWAPRSMDLDILLFGDRICSEPGLTLPRPDLVRRPYMLGPTVELAPQLRHPTLGKTLAEIWAGFDPAAHVMRPVDLQLDGALP